MRHTVTAITPLSCSISSSKLFIPFSDHWVFFTSWMKRKSEVITRSQKLAAAERKYQVKLGVHVLHLSSFVNGANKQCE